MAPDSRGTGERSSDDTIDVQPGDSPGVGGRTRDATVDRRRFLTQSTAAAAAAVTTAVGGCLGVLEDDPSFDGEVETVADGFEHPWGIAFVPDDSRLLVTERPGRLRLLDREDGSVERVDGVPDVHAVGQGGLLDVALHPDYLDEPWLYLTYAGSNGAGESTTYLGRGELDPDDRALDSFEELYVAEPFESSDGHYGSRVVFDHDDRLYVSIGDRQVSGFDADHPSQDPGSDLGTTLRLDPDGSIPDDNPFVDDPDAGDAVYSYGHRNVQGLTVHTETGDVWASEHGEEDGDELNRLEAGGNYGWPIAHTGCEYGTETPVGDDPRERDDVVDPAYAWECTTGGFPPAGATIYQGEAFPDWEGDLLVGSLAGQRLARFALEDGEAQKEESLLGDGDWRLRDVAVAPDTGHVYLAIDYPDAPLVRLVPN